MTDLLDDDTVDAILAGEAHGSVPAEFARVAELARAARVHASGAAPATSRRDLEVIDAIASAVRRGSAWNSTDTVVPFTRRRRRGTAAGLAVFAAVTLSATAAAAATNHLPSALQDALSNAASHVGVHFPTADGGDQPASTPPATGEVPQHDVTAASASAADNAPPTATPGLDGTADNSDHQNEPGDIASEAHSDNPSSADDGHSQSGGDHGSVATTQSESTKSTESSRSTDDSDSSDGSGSNSVHSDRRDRPTS